MKTTLKTIISIVAFAMLLSACGTTTMVTSSWRKPNATANNYRNIFVAALTNNIPAKQAVENGIQDQLQAKGLTVEKSIDVLPPDIKQTGQQKDLIMGKIRGTNADAILTITLLRKKEQTRFVPTGGAYWNPGFRYGYYNNFWNYYNTWYPTVYGPGYYDTTQIYYLETNLYDAHSEQLIWAAQSQTYDPANIDSFLKGYIKAIYERMVKDGLLTGSAAAATNSAR
jgi:hypothetical protein